MVLYLDNLPDEILIIISSKSVSLDSLSKCSYRMHRLFSQNSICELILKYKNPEYHSFIKTCKNVRGSPQWCNILLSPLISDIYHVNVHYLYLISKEFPAIYSYIKDVDLNNSIVGSRDNWFTIYSNLNELKSYDFIKGKFSKETCVVLLEKFENINATVLLIIFMIKRLTISKLGIVRVFEMFIFSKDMYDKIHELVALKREQDMSSKTLDMISTLHDYVRDNKGIIPKYLLVEFIDTIYCK